jgi:hypothetical protein
MQQSPSSSILNTSINAPATTTLPNNQQQQQQLLSRPASAYFNNSNTSNLSNPTANLNQSLSYNNMMAPPMTAQSQQPQTHISHPNLSNMPSSSSTNPSLLVQMPLTANRPPILPNKNNFMRESQSQHSLRMTHQQPNSQAQQPQQQQQQMMAPSMPNIAHASGYATNIPASQSMQNVNQINQNYPMYQSQQSPSQQPLIRGQQQQQSKMAEMGARRNNQMSNGMIHTNSMDNIATTQQQQIATMMKPFSAGNIPQSPQKQLPPTAPKPQVSYLKFNFFHPNPTPYFKSSIHNCIKISITFSIFNNGFSNLLD